MYVYFVLGFSLKYMMYVYFVLGFSLKYMMYVYFVLGFSLKYMVYFALGNRSIFKSFCNNKKLVISLTFLVVNENSKQAGSEVHRK